MHFKAEFFTKFKTSWIIFRYLFCLSVMPISINYIHSVFLLLFLSHFPTLFPSFAILRANHMPQFLVFVFVHTVSFNVMAIIFSLFPFLPTSFSLSCFIFLSLTYHPSLLHHLFPLKLISLYLHCSFLILPLLLPRHLETNIHHDSFFFLSTLFPRFLT